MEPNIEYPYATYLDIRFQPLSLVDVPALIAACTDRWYNQTLCQVNDSVVRLGVMQGEYHWHKHDRDDEFFFVLDGRFVIDLEDRSVELGPRQGFVVPRGVVHRTRAPERAVILMVENAGIVPPGTRDRGASASTPRGEMTPPAPFGYNIRPRPQPRLRVTTGGARWRRHPAIAGLVSAEPFNSP